MCSRGPGSSHRGPSCRGQFGPSAAEPDSHQRCGIRFAIFANGLGRNPKGNQPALLTTTVLRFEPLCSFSGHRLGHSFARIEREQTFASVTKIAAFSRIVRLRLSFGTRGSQVQILPLRLRLKLIFVSSRPQPRPHEGMPISRRTSPGVRPSSH